MNQVSVKFAELHVALFLNGKNFGLKLDPTKITGLTMIYDYDKEELLVSWNKLPDVAHIMKSTCAYYIVGEIDPPPASVTELPRERITAQVDSPMMHVHAGPGKGKTGKS